MDLNGIGWWSLDTIGNYRLCWRSDADGFIFCSDLSGCSSHTLRIPTGPAAVADYLTFGAVLGRGPWSKTSVCSIGTVLTYDIQERRVSLSSTCDWRRSQNKATDKAEYLDRVQQAFVRAVDRAASGTVRSACHCRADSTAARFSAHSGQVIRRITTRLASRAVPIRSSRNACRRSQERATSAARWHLSSRFPAEHDPDGVPDRRDMPSHGLTEMLAITFLGQGIQVLLRGHGGELASAPGVPCTPMQRVGMTSVDELVP